MDFILVYPSLLFYREQECINIPVDVFFDIKLDALLPESVFDIMGQFCNEENISKRQELFRAFDKGVVYEEFLELSKLTSKLDVLGERYGSDICEEEKAFVFLALIEVFIEFSKKASLLPREFSSLSDRFSDFFKELIDSEDFLRIEEEANRLFGIVKEMDKFSFVIRGEALKVVSKKDEAFSDKLILCAKELELSGRYQKKCFFKDMSSNIISAFCRMMPENYSLVKAFYEKNARFFDRDMLKYKGELEFYCYVYELLLRVKQNSIPVVYPCFDSTEKRIFISDAYDISLLAKNQSFIVPNDVEFFGDYSFSFLTGANGGGKTTYLRAIGINLLLALNGAPIAAKSGSIYPLKRIFTHFPRDERFENTGRFVDEENRISSILAEIDTESLILLNETYSTTSKEVAIERTDLLATKLSSMGVFGIYITHQHNVDSSVIPVLSVIVDENDENKRTYKISKKSQEKKSFADDILKKYDLTKEALGRRFGVSI